MALEWSGFQVKPGETVHFIQPNREAIALNRVLGNEAAIIDGALTANGQVFLVNPNGVLFGKSAHVNVGGLLASTLALSDPDFLTGNYQFRGAANAGSILNQGKITAADQGYIAFLGGQVSNQGVLQARLGQVRLAAGSEMRLDFAGDGLLSVAVTQGALNALAENKQLIMANGGEVHLTAKAANDLLRAVVNHDGLIEAQRVENRGGKIYLVADMEHGVTQVNGKLDASAPAGGDGGFIETSAATVHIGDLAQITTKAALGKSGTWLIDPTDYTIAAVGGNMSGATLSANLANGDVMIASTDGSVSGTGSIYVKDWIRWASDHTLTLSADKDIYVQAPVTATGNAAGLVLNYGSGADYHVRAPITLSGRNATLQINGANYQLLHSMDEMEAKMNADLSGNYALAEDVDASGKVYTEAVVGKASNNPFTGVFTGLGHTIRKLNMDTSQHDIESPDATGLFGDGRGNLIRDMGLNEINIKGIVSVGALVGYQQHGNITNVYVSGDVSGIDQIGGMVGFVHLNPEQGIPFAELTMRNVYANVAVSGTLSKIGGLIGQSTVDSTSSLLRAFILSKAYASGAVIGADAVGGLIGNASGMIPINISNVYATGSVNGDVAGKVVGKGAIGSDAPLLSADDSKSLSIYKNAGWDIDDAPGTGSVWRIYEGQTTPLLRGFLRPVTVSPADKGYDGLTHGAGYAASDPAAAPLVFGQSAYTTASADVGTYTTVDHTLRVDSDLYSTQTGYDIRVADSGSVKISPAPLRITAKDGSIPENELPYTGGGVDYTGLVNAQTASVLSGTLVYGGSAKTATREGRYEIVPSGLSATNYDIRYENGTLVVGPALVIDIPGGPEVEGPGPADPDRVDPDPGGLNTEESNLSAIADVVAGAGNPKNPTVQTFTTQWNLSPQSDLSAPRRISCDCGWRHPLARGWDRGSASSHLGYCTVIPIGA